MKAGDKVLIKYPNKAPQKAVLTLLKSKQYNGELYWSVKERTFDIPAYLLIIKT
jgi:hypothetical protein